jgi:hypothetical protein
VVEESESSQNKFFLSKLSVPLFFASMMLRPFRQLPDRHPPSFPQLRKERKTSPSPQAIVGSSNRTHQHLDVVGAVSCSKSKASRLSYNIFSRPLLLPSFKRRKPTRL